MACLHIVGCPVPYGVNLWDYYHIWIRSGSSMCKCKYTTVNPWMDLSSLALRSAEAELWVNRARYILKTRNVETRFSRLVEINRVVN